jgi:hypothetical protein
MLRPANAPIDNNEDAKNISTQLSSVMEATADRRPLTALF